MASRYAAAASRRKSPIDLPLAAAAALAVGFVAFAMPGDILSRLVEMSGLPSVLAMAEPPLGLKARAGVSLAAAIVTFAAIFLLLRRLGRPSESRRERERGDESPFKVDELDAIAPRLRRADVHPDAPARRPILAARELGEPRPEAAPAADWPLPQPAAEPEPEIAESEAMLDELELTIPDIVPVDEVIDEAPAREAEPAGDASIADLMARLERGFARRLGQKPATPAAGPPREPERAFASSTHDGDDRLRSAIENLQKMAARAG